MGSRCSSCPDRGGGRCSALATAQPVFVSLRRQRRRWLMAPTRPVTTAQMAPMPWGAGSPSSTARLRHLTRWHGRPGGGLGGTAPAAVPILARDWMGASPGPVHVRAPAWVADWVVYSSAPPSVRRGRRPPMMRPAGSVRSAADADLHGAGTPGAQRQRGSGPRIPAELHVLPDATTRSARSPDPASPSSRTGCRLEQPWSRPPAPARPRSRSPGNSCGLSCTGAAQHASHRTMVDRRY